jgi:hypothetical protein
MIFSYVIAEMINDASTRDSSIHTLKENAERARRGRFDIPWPR